MRIRLKAAALVLALAFLSACLGAKSMQVVYTIGPAAALRNYTVILVINDLRSIQGLVGPAARSQGLFEELQGDRFDLKVKKPDGSEVTMTNLTTVLAVREAVGQRLTARGVTVTAQRLAAQLTVEIDIRDLSLDVVGSDLAATVNLTSRVYREPSASTTYEANIVYNRLRILGGIGGDKVLSEALTMAVNELDFTAINNY